MRAQAQTALPMVLVWEAPAECPKQAEVLEQIASLAPQSPQVPSRAQALVRRQPEGTWEARLTLEGASGFAQRTLQGESCKALADAVALVLAMTVVREPTPPAPPPQPKPSPVVRTSKERVWGIGLAGLVDSGTLPSVGVGLAANVSYSSRALRAELEFNWLLPQGATLDARPGEGANFSLLRLGVRGCHTVGAGPLFRLGPCLTAGMEWVTGDGFGSNYPSVSTSYSPALGGGVLGLLRLHARLDLRVGMDLSFALKRPTFVIENAGAVHRTDFAVVRFFLGHDLRF